MKSIAKPTPIIALGAALVALAQSANGVDLLQRYPTTLTGGLVDPSQARQWQITAQDVFKVSRFRFEVGDQLEVDTGPADLGIGHCSDGAVCAVLIPTEGGKLTRPGGAAPEEIAHIWLRFHPAEINRLFPPDTVSAGSGGSVIAQMRTVAGGKFRAGYHAGMNAMIPEPKDMTVDVDTKAGVRRFFAVDTQAKKAEYVNAFERQPVRIATRTGSGPGGGKNAPKILFTKPADGAKDVDPALAEITVTFDQDMDAGFSWTGGGPEYPPSPDGVKVQWRGKRTCVLPVKLEARHAYRVGINSPSHQNFRSAAGEAVQPSSISFATK